MKPLLNQTRRFDLLCLGAIAADFIFLGIDEMPQTGNLKISEKMEFHLGGSATNTALAFAKLGGKTILIGSIGEDFIGNLILDQLRKTEIYLDGISKIGGATAVTMVLVSPNGERTFVYYPGATSYLSSQMVNTNIFSETKAVHFADTFALPALDGNGTLSLMKAAKKRGAIISLDTSWDPENRWLKVIMPYLPFVDFLFCNLSEAAGLTGYVDPEQASRVLLDLGSAMVVVKMGERGSLITNSSFSLKLPAIKARTIDTTGAGDCYIAGFLFGYLKGWNYEKIGRFASAAGKLCVESVGGTSGILSFEQVLIYLRSS